MIFYWIRRPAKGSAPTDPGWRGPSKPVQIDPPTRLWRDQSGISSVAEPRKSKPFLIRPIKALSEL